jgi:hypothetical protein
MIPRFGEESNRPSEDSTSTDLANRTTSFFDDVLPENGKETTTEKYLNAYNEEIWLTEATMDTVKIDRNGEESDREYQAQTTVSFMDDAVGSSEGTTKSTTTMSRLWGYSDHSSEEADDDRLLVKQNCGDSDENV